MGQQVEKRKNIICFTGENTFALREEQRRWMEQFREKHDEYNLLMLEGGELTVRALLDEVAVAPFLAERRLVFVRGMPRFSREEMETVLAHTHPATVLVFNAGKPDRRLGGLKLLLAQATVKDFPLLRGAKLLAWMRSIPAAEGLHMEDDALRALLVCIGEDQDMLYHELRKLSLFVGTGTIACHHVRTLTVANSVDDMLWQLGEFVGKGNVQKTLMHIHELLERGTDPFHLWNTLLWMLKCFVQVSMLRAEGVGERDLVRHIALHPPMAKACCAIAQATDIPRLQEVLYHALDADHAMKTGEYRANAAEPAEILALVDQLVLRLAAAMV